MKILGIIPARSGSKGIHLKNIKEIAGKPLISYTIEKAQQSQLIDTCVVSTESLKIDDIARECGATVIRRPVELAEDDSPTIDVLTHALKVVEEETQIKYDIVVLLQATSPVRGEYLIDYCISQFVLLDYDSLVTGYICKDIPYDKKAEKLRRQDINGFFACDGNVYVVKADLVRKGQFVGKHVGHILTTKEENVDIDNDYDFWLAEQILLKRGE